MSNQTMPIQQFTDLFNPFTFFNIREGNQHRTWHAEAFGCQAQVDARGLDLASNRRRAEEGPGGEQAGQRADFKGATRQHQRPAGKPRGSGPVPTPGVQTTRSS